MPKRPIQQRWRDEELERYRRFRNSSDCARVKGRGLAILGRSRQMELHEWDSVVRPVFGSQDWSSFSADCRSVGDVFGLTKFTVEMGALIRGYRPEGQPFPIASSSPSVCIITNVEPDSAFFINLLAHASELGLTVKSRAGTFPPARQGFTIHQGGRFTTSQPFWQTSDLADDERPLLGTALRVKVEFPPIFPSELAAEWTRDAVQAQAELARMLGYKVPQRLRVPSVSQRG